MLWISTVRKCEVCSAR